GLRQLTTSGANFQPSWNGARTQIAFVSTRDNYGQSIYVMNADGSNQHCVTAAGSGSSDLHPSFNPGGTRIASARTVNGISTLMTMNADGSGLVYGTAGQAPAWSPD